MEPIHEEGCIALDDAVRLAVYGHFIEHACAPTAVDLAEAVSTAPVEVQAALERLQARHALALAPGSGGIWMAHPFSAVPTAYPVHTERHTYWANCALDALAMPALLDTDAETHTRCPDCAERIGFRVRDGRLEESGDVVHFLVPPRSFWENVGFT